MCFILPCLYSTVATSIAIYQQLPRTLMIAAGGVGVWLGWKSEQEQQGHDLA